MNIKFSDWVAARRLRENSALGQPQMSQHVGPDDDFYAGPHEPQTHGWHGDPHQEYDDYSDPQDYYNPEEEMEYRNQFLRPQPYQQNFDDKDPYADMQGLPPESLPGPHDAVANQPMQQPMRPRPPMLSKREKRHLEKGQMERALGSWKDFRAARKAAKRGMVQPDLSQPVAPQMGNSDPNVRHFGGY